MINILVNLAKGKSLARILMDEKISKTKIKGEVLDLGAGKHPYYHDLFKKEGEVHFIRMDISAKNNVSVNLEKDHIPRQDNSVDVLIMFNLLEHVFNYDFLCSEVVRVVKKNGHIYGFVPFLLRYHPDPNDYFRYTREALQKIFSRSSLKVLRLEEIGSTSIYVNYNNFVLSIPLFLRLILFPVYYYLDKIYLLFRPNIKKIYPLGYWFELIK